MNMKTTGTTYKVIKKGNGKFAPRIFRSGDNWTFGNCWFKEPYEFDKLEDAIEAIKREKLGHEEQQRLNSEEVVFEL